MVSHFVDTYGIGTAPSLVFRSHGISNTAIRKVLSRTVFRRNCSTRSNLKQWCHGCAVGAFAHRERHYIGSLVGSSQCIGFLDEHIKRFVNMYISFLDVAFGIERFFLKAGSKRHCSRSESEQDMRFCHIRKSNDVMLSS